MPAKTVKAKETTPTDVVKWCMNNLGIDLDDEPGTPTWKRVSIEAGKLKRQLAANRGVSTDDLMVAARWCARHRVIITSPSGLIYHVDKARRDVVPDPAETDVDTALGDAIATEVRRRDDGDDEAGRWLRRLQRAIGPHREATLAEWRNARG